MNRLRDLLLTPGRRRTTALLSTVATAAAICLAVILALNGNDVPPKVVADDLSGRPTACLAADTATAAKNTDSTRAWAAMQRGAQGLKVNIQQLVVPATPEQAKPDLAGLLAQHCTLIITVGQPFGQAITAEARLSPATRFLTVDAGSLPASPTITQLDSSSAPTSVQAAVAALSNKR